MRILATIILLLATLTGQAAKLDIKRVEPLNWWTGMKNQTLQIMVYGDNISTYRPQIDYPGVKIETVVTTTNPNYEFIYIHIDATAQPGTFNITFWEGKKSVGSHPYRLEARREASADRKGFDSSDAMYLLMPDRFANGNPANDSHEAVTEKANRSDKDGRHGGDIEGIIGKLDYLKELGFTALWSTPMMEDNMPITSYHTYAISDYYKIDPRYGTNDDYRRLSAEAKKRGIKLVMDVVTNHCATEHWWMKDLPTEDWTHQFDEFTRCNFRVWTIQDPNASQVDKQLNTQGWFDTSMADINQSNLLVLDYLTQNTIWWIEYADLGGLRIDTYPYNDKEPMAEFCYRIMTEYPDFNIVGECWMHEPVEVAYWQKGVENPDGYTSELPSVMDFPLTDALALFGSEEQGWNTGIMRPYLNMAKDYLYADPNQLLLFADNHDTERIWHLLKGDKNKFKLVFTLLSTVRGIPQVYYGTEIMMAGEKQIGDGDIRRDFPGGWQGDTVNAFTREGRTAEQNEIFDFMSRLLNWRRDAEVIHTGKTKHFVPENECYVYFRYTDKDTVMVVLNNSDKEEKTLDLSRFAEMLNGMTKGQDIISGHTIKFENTATTSTGHTAVNKRQTKVQSKDTLTIPAKTAMVITLK